MKQYELYKTEDGINIFLRKYTEKQFLSFVDAKESLTHYTDCLKAYSILLDNLKDLKRVLLNLNKDTERKHVFTPIVYDGLESLISTSFFNLLSAFYHFMNFIEAKFKEWFDKESDETKFLTQKKSEYFDEYFEYRFFYKLRNYITHKGLPLQFITEGTDGKGCHFIQAYYFTSILLDDYDEWGKVKKDLLGREYVMIFPTVFSFDKMINKLWSEIYNFLKLRFSEAATILNDLIGGIDKISNDNKLFIWEYDGDGTDSIYERLEQGNEVVYKEIEIKAYILRVLLDIK